MVKRSIAALDPGDVARLRRGFRGQVLLPDQGGYDEARRVWNAMVDWRPAVIARCASPADVAAAVGFARGEGLELGVRCGGHSILGLSVPQGGLMIDLTPMGSGVRRAYGPAKLARLAAVKQRYDPDNIRPPAHQDSD